MTNADYTENVQISLESFITKHNLKFECHQVDARPDSGTEWDSAARHFRCRIISSRYIRNNFPMRARSMKLYFSQGSVHTQDPILADVLDCLASDAAGYENAKPSPRSPKDHFVSWAVEYGYDGDSRKAERTFKAIKRQAEQLKRTIGEDAYQELLWNTERL
jgi:hypothetical protein